MTSIRNCPVIRCIPEPVNPPVFLRSQLDLGEASVIQNALLRKVSTVVIDEKVGRRMARLHDLRVTGSIGILVKASKARLVPDLNSCFNLMHEKGVWISATLKQQAFRAAKLD